MNKGLPKKKYSQVGYCGINCSLCPKYYTNGKTKCNGCCGSNKISNFNYCTFINCAGKKKSIEICSQCEEFPCKKFEKFTRSDSYVTHKNILDNLKYIKEKGIEKFINHLKEKEKLLVKFLKELNEGRSKSLFCRAVALLDIDDLKQVLLRVESENKGNINIKEKARQTKLLLNELAHKRNIDLNLRK